MLRHIRPLNKLNPYLVYILTLLLTYFTWQFLVDKQELACIAALGMLILGLMDWILLAALPRLGLSYGSIRLSWFLMLCGRIIYLLVFILPLLILFHIRPAMKTPGMVLGALILWGFANLAASAVEFYSMYIEPFDLRVTTLRLPGPTFFPDRSLRIVQLADIHIERGTKREQEILARLIALRPDLIVLTGDYVNYDFLFDPRAIQEARAFLAKLAAPLGVYAISGSRLVDPPELMAALFSGLNIRVLNDQAQLLKIGEGAIYLMGIQSQDNGARDRDVLLSLKEKSPPGAYSLLLYHSPDQIEAAAESGVNLYLAGHTHGGQIRLPFIGALITLSAYGRKYASGRHHLGPTILYTSRGLGLEGLHLPRARFLCPPEMVVVEFDPGLTGKFRIDRSRDL
jgi:predicted MPP superfamily phosphohydrolase